MNQGFLKISPSDDPANIEKWAERIGPSGWFILESYPAVVFKSWQVGAPLPPLGDEFAGRIFGARGELRWTRDGDTFSLWLLEDVEPGQGDGEPYNVEPRQYYALGYWHDGKYWEPRLRAGGVHYPIAAGKEGDRPRFLVREYYRIAPAKWPEAVEEFEDLVNQPSLAAYRLVGFDAGKDGG